METTLNKRELLWLALNAEKASFALYSRAAEASDCEMIKRIYQRIARDELDHLMRLLAKFDRLYPELVKEVNISLPTPSESEIARLARINGPSEALQNAIKEEQRSLHIYLQLAKAMENREATSALRTIIQDEVNHIKALRSIGEAKIKQTAAKEKRLH